MFIRTRTAAALLLASVLTAMTGPAIAQSNDAVPHVREGPLLLLWDRGAEVQAWQVAINDWLDSSAPERARLATDGIYGPNTQQATIDFQRAAQIAVDGIVGPQTRSAMVDVLTDGEPAEPGEEDLAERVSSGPLLYLWMRGAEVAEWQTAFNQWVNDRSPGVDRIAVDGIYGPNTQEATIDFQTATEIAVDGLVGPQTRSTMADQLRGDAPQPPDDDGGDDGRLDADDVLSDDIDTSEDSGEADGPQVSVTDVRAGRHDGFDRVVFDIGGEGIAGWDVEYVDEAVAQGSGRPIDVEGDAILAVTLDNIALPTEPPEGVEPYDGPERVALGQPGPVMEIVSDTVFEGHHTFFVGVDGEQPFQVNRLDSPQRIVLDVAG